MGKELGIEPSPELQDLENQILGQDPTLDAVARRAPAADPTATDATRGCCTESVQGSPAVRRDRRRRLLRSGGLVEELIRRVADDRFVAVVGPSGSGKSSVVRAGLIPAVRAGADRWAIAQMQPGAHPFEELEVALLRATPEAAQVDLGGQRRGDDLDLLRWVLRLLPDEEARLLLVIDQFEELFLLVAEEEERAGSSAIWSRRSRTRMAA